MPPKMWGTRDSINKMDGSDASPETTEQHKKGLALNNPKCPALSSKIKSAGPELDC